MVHNLKWDTYTNKFGNNHLTAFYVHVTCEMTVFSHVSIFRQNQTRKCPVIETTQYAITEIGSIQ